LKEESKGEKETEKEGKRTFPSVGRYTIPFLYDQLSRTSRTSNHAFQKLKFILSKTLFMLYSLREK
jgi:hypothetical protein